MDAGKPKVSTRRRVPGAPPASPRSNGRFVDVPLLKGLLSVCLVATPFMFMPRPSARAVSSRRQFADVAARSKFSYRSNNDFTGRKYFPQPMCGGIAVLDYDGDGLMDLFFTNGAKLPELKKTDSSFYHCLFRNRGDGTFEDVTEKAGLAGVELGFSFGVAAGDYDNDGRPDLFIANAGKNTLYHN